MLPAAREEVTRWEHYKGKTLSMKVDHSERAGRTLDGATNSTATPTAPSLPILPAER